MPSLLCQSFPLASNMLSYIDIFQDVVLKLAIPVLWQHLFLVEENTAWNRKDDGELIKSNSLHLASRNKCQNITYCVSQMTHKNVYCFQVISAVVVVDTKTEISGDLTLIYGAKWCLTCFLCGNISVILRNPNIAAGRCPYYLTTVVNTVPHSA